jgi:Tol biopolymer transport system component
MPDARSMLYGVDIGVHGLWRVNVTGADMPRQIAIGPDQSCWPAISPRTRRLVYSKFTSGSDVWIFEKKGGQRKLVDSTRHERVPQFSPRRDTDCLRV